LMSFDATDFNLSSFDLIYAQASISSTKRNKIVKEIKRILKPGGYFCVGEIVILHRRVPMFVQNIFDSSDLLPLFNNDLNKYYHEKNFILNGSIDLTNTLKEFYLRNATLLKNSEGGLTQQERSYYKKLVNKISHESNAYLRLGANKYIGFTALLLQRGFE